MAMVRIPTLLFILLIFSSTSHADALSIRLNLGYGSASSSELSGNRGREIIGARVLRDLTRVYRYGFDLNHFYGDSGDVYTAAGFVLEKHKFRSLNFNFGGLGYFGFDEENPFGLMAAIAWEPRYKKQHHPYVGLRTDLVLATHSQTIVSINAGYRWQF